MLSNFSAAGARFARLVAIGAMLTGVATVAQLDRCQAQSIKTVVVPPTGEYGTIDTTQTIALMRTLGATSGHENDALVDGIKARADTHPPPVFFALAQLLYQRGDLDDSIFWFNAGRLRASYDAMRCADISARSAVPALVMQIPVELRKAQFGDPDKLRTIITKVIAWDEATPHNYDHRWINLHGLQAFGGGTAPLSVPQDKWDGLARQVREDYRKGLEEAIALSNKPKQ